MLGSMMGHHRIRLSSIVMTILACVVIMMVWINMYSLRKNSASYAQDQRTVDVTADVRLRLSWDSQAARVGGQETVNNDAAHPDDALTKDTRCGANFIALNTYVPSGKSSDNQEALIPHIIHQSWDRPSFPRYFTKWISSWVKHNPKWQYWFWTLADARKLIQKHYPDFITLFDTYNEDIFRSDALRYFVLHKFGGVYIDFDMEGFKPLDNWTYNHHCIVSEETYEHPFIVRESTGHANILNGFIAARPGHAFLNKTIASLNEFAGRYFGDYLYATGPFFLDVVLKRYKKERGNALKSGSPNDVTVLPPQYFFPTYDRGESEIITGKCFKSNIDQLPLEGQMTCNELEKTFYRKVPGPESFADHHWLHAFMFDESWKTKDVIRIKDIVPHATDPSEMI